MEVASVARDAAVDDTKVAGSVITAVAYASPAPATGSLAAINNAVSDTQAPAEQAIAAVSAPAGQAELPPAETTEIAAKADAAPAAKAEEVAAAVPVDQAVAAPDAPVVLASLEPSAPKKVAARSPELDSLIERYAQLYEVPVNLVRRVVKRESTFNPAARNGPYWGLMQIRHDTAKGMGYKGSAQGLLNAETNLTYAVKYLKGAYVTAKGDHDQAVRYYSRGYYYDAKKRGLLEEAGLKKGKAATPVQVAAAEGGAQKKAEMDRGASLVAQGLPGVTSGRGGRLPLPSTASLSSTAPAPATLAIAE